MFNSGSNKCHISTLSYSGTNGGLTHSLQVRR